MKGKTILLALSCVAVASLLLTSCARHPRRQHRPDPEVMLRRLDTRVKKLELTEAQTRQYKEIRTRFKRDLLNDFSSLKNTHTEISAQIMMDDPDIPAIADELKQRMAGSPDLRAKYLDYFVEFYNILDEDQKQKVLKHINRRLKHVERVHS